jgi:hypothetical protein
MKAIVTGPILLAAFTVVIHAAAHATEVKSPKTNASVTTPKINAPATTGNGGGSGSKGKGSTGSNGAKGGAKPLQGAIFHFFEPGPSNSSLETSSPPKKRK